MYSNKELGATARNLRIEDIEEHYTGERAGTPPPAYAPSNKYYPEIFALEEGGNVGEGYGSIGRSEMPSTGLDENGYILQESTKQASTLRGQYTYYGFTMTESNMGGQAYADLFKTTKNCHIASRCVMIDNNRASFFLFYVDGNKVAPYHLYNSDVYLEFRGLALRPVITLDAKSVAIGNTGSGTADNPYSIEKK